jgi:hypothetical protein
MICLHQLLSRLRSAPTGVSIIVGALLKREWSSCQDIADAIRYRIKGRLPGL